MAKVREKYWLPSLQYLVKKMMKNCNSCKKSPATVFQVPIAGITYEIPKVTQETTPFQALGDEFASPIKVGKRRKSIPPFYQLL